MGKILWLASYPKSGNTWVRMFLNSYFWGEEEKQNLNSLDLSTYGGSSKSSYREVTSRNVDALDDKSIMELTPSAHAFIASRHSHLVFAKTHNILSTYHDVPLITPSVTHGAVYILRNPLDMVLSVADHFGLSVDKAIDFIANPNGSTAPNETMVRQIFCSWPLNVQSWTEQAPFPVFVMRYEDMQEKPADSFSRLLGFLGTKADPKKLNRALKQSSFKALKNMERKGGFNEKSRHSRSFFRVGKTGQWKTKLTEEQVKKIVQTHRPLMEKFGYIPSGF
ncbi:MAG: sulfotransferase domain-containing protein [Sneathiellales bacterium]|nr:sulfotransferase domain-containing protein [Sneathiellales bacterium]